MRQIFSSKERKKNKRVSGSQLKSLTILLFVLPGGLLTLIFGWYPMVGAFVVAFQKFQIIGVSKWVGLSNFKFILGDPMLPTIFRNTLYYTSLSIGLTFFISILVSILLMEMNEKTIRIMMWLWFIPLSSMAGIVIWKWMYNVEYGLLNGILVALHLPKSAWLNDARLAMLCLVLPGLVMYAPGLIYMTSLQIIPEELYENAHLEGAGLWQQVWYITLPRLRPLISMMLILAIIGNLQIFSQPYIMTAGGPGISTTTIVMQIYRLAFTSFAFGKATSLGVMLFFLITFLVILQRKFFKEDIDK